MPHGEHAVHGTPDLSLSAERSTTRARHWRPGGRVWQALQRATVAAALIGLGYGLSAVLHEDVPGVVANLALSRKCSERAASGRPQEILSEDPYEELPGIRPHDAEYWQWTFPRQVEEMVNATISGGFSLVFYGDSITEQLRDLEQECGLWGCPGGGEISRKVFGQWPSINMAIGGEPSWSMLYRLRNGALAGRDAGVRVVVLATGTNDIGFEMGRSLHEPQQHAQEIVQRIAAMTRLVRLRLPAATVIMLGVFPRHWGGEFDGRQYAEDAWPNPLAKVMKMIADGLTVVAEHDEHVVFHDCSRVFVVKGTLPRDLLHDGLHPSLQGRELWAKCLAERVRDFMEA